MFGDRLKELRNSKNLSQDDLGKILGVRKSSISNWETDKATPTYEILTKLAQYFNVTTDYLLGLNQDDLNKIDKLNKALREAGMIDNNENLKEEEIKLALDQARKYKQMLTKILDTPNKYPEESIKQELNNNTKDTNE